MNLEFYTRRRIPWQFVLNLYESSFGIKIRTNNLSIEKALNTNNRVPKMMLWASLQYQVDRVYVDNVIARYI